MVLPSNSPAARREVPSFETLSAEMESLKRHLSQIDSPTVLCHNDLLTKNIIYDHNEGEEQQWHVTRDVTPNTDRNRNFLSICSSAVEEYVAEANECLLFIVFVALPFIIQTFTGLRTRSYFIKNPTVLCCILLILFLSHIFTRMWTFSQKRLLVPLSPTRFCRLLSIKGGRVVNLMPKVFVMLSW